MRLFILVLGGLLVGCPDARAQSVVSRSDTVVTFQSKNTLPVATRSEAFYRVKTVRTDSLGGVEYRYMLDSGWLAARQEYRNLVLRIAHGLSEEYYPMSRQRRYVAHYQDAKLEGEMLSYHVGGQLRRREQFKENASLGGQCYNEVGEPVFFVPYMVLPEFQGGGAALMRFIGANLRYPQAALRAALQSRVLVTFVVDTQGQVQHAKVTDPGFPSLDAEALRVVNLLKKWKPGRLEGEAQDVSYTLPINFQIQ